MDAEAQFLERYQKLNDQQRQAVDALDGPVLVVAGPGSGKTELLSLRVANILRQKDLAPGNILCLTFTEAAATNMRQRLAGLVGPLAYRVAIHTFHSFSTEVINRYPEYFYSGASFQPADELTQLELLSEVFATLPYNNPLSSKHEQEFTYLRDTQRAIGDLKKAGLTPKQFENILIANQKAMEAIVDWFDPVFGQRIGKQTLPAAQSLVEQLAQAAQNTAGQPEPETVLGQPESIVRQLGKSLAIAVAEAEVSHKTAPLSEWKAKFLTKNSSGVFVPKDYVVFPKMQSLQAIYDQYRQSMHQQGYFDFDDMLLDVLQALTEHPDLRFAIQEQYQYVLVDEFQDTNDAQLRLVGYITDAPVYEGRPNILAVGDDDQAIYKFQGAKISNIHQFNQHYTGVNQIVLTKNYRSGADILAIARQVILQGEDRLENYYADINKELEAAGEIGSGRVAFTACDTREHEFYTVSQQIAQQIKSGVSPNEIAIIARRHKDLEDISAYLENQGVPVRYDRQRNVLLEPHIHQLVTIARFVHQMARHNAAEADELLPEILSYPFWGLDRDTVWELSVKASQANKPSERLWVYQMEQSSQKQLPIIAAWFKQLRNLAESEPLESMLEKLIGAHTPLLPIDMDADDSTWMQDRPRVNGYTSPFKEYYFDELKRQSERSQYISFLSSLQVFITALRAYKPGRPLKLEDVINFVDVHQANNLPVTDTTVYASGEKAVQLVTAHGAKGLEFPYVYILSCQKSVWTPAARGNKLAFPSNLPISSEADDRDDMLRIFYVALTRAQRGLFLSNYRYDAKGKEVEGLEFIAGIELELAPVESATSQSELILSTTWETYHRPPLVASEKALLLPLVEDYQLSVTHLNDFLDVTRGGPQSVLEQHLLRFPQPSTLAQAYGTAVHRSLQEFFQQFKYDAVLPALEYLLQALHRALTHERLAESDFEQLWQRGQSELTLYYESKSSSFGLQDIVERNFNSQQVVVGSAHLTGKIDRIVEVAKGRVSVHDIKTGKPSASWSGGDANQKIKLDKYRRQLLFYKLLVEHSRDYSNLQVVSGILEFIEDLDGKFIELSLPLDGLDKDELERLKLLINAVYIHIQQLNFPEISGYSSDISGMRQFEDDLIEGKI